MLGKPLSWRASAIITIASALLILVAYFALSAWKHDVNPTDKTVPTLGQMQAGIAALWLDRPGEGRWALIDMKAGAERFAAGLALGSALAFSLGLLTGCFKKGYYAFLPLLAVLGNVPTTAMLSVYYMFIKSNDMLYVALVAAAILPAMEQGVRLAVGDIRPEQINTARMRGASTVEIILHVIVPQILPRFVDHLMAASAAALTMLVCFEMVVGGGEGIGYRIRLVMMKLEMSQVIPYLVILACAGIINVKVLEGLQRLAFPWYQNGRK